MEISLRTERNHYKRNKSAYPAYLADVLHALLRCSTPYQDCDQSSYCSAPWLSTPFLRLVSLGDAELQTFYNGSRLPRSTPKGELLPYHMIKGHVTTQMSQRVWQKHHSIPANAGWEC